MVGLTICVLLINRRRNADKSTVEYIDKNESFYLNGYLGEGSMYNTNDWNEKFAGRSQIDFFLIALLFR